MEVSFQLAEGDYLAFCDYRLRQTPAGWRLRTRAALGALALFLLYAALESRDARFGVHNPAGYAAHMAIAAGVFVMALRVGMAWAVPMWARMALRFGTARHVLAPATVRISRAAFAIETARGAGRIAWKDIDDIGSVWDQLFVFAAGGGGFIIPKRAFASIEAYEVFYRAMMEYFDAAHTRGAKA